MTGPSPRASTGTSSPGTWPGRPTSPTSTPIPSLPTRGSDGSTARLTTMLRGRRSREQSSPAQAPCSTRSRTRVRGSTGLIHSRGRRSRRWYWRSSTTAGNKAVFSAGRSSFGRRSIVPPSRLEYGAATSCHRHRLVACLPDHRGATSTVAGAVGVAAGATGCSGAVENDLQKNWLSRQPFAPWFPSR